MSHLPRDARLLGGRVKPGHGEKNGVVCAGAEAQKRK
jgi:hypothetical protein